MVLDINKIKNSLPKFELCFESILQKKVRGDLFIALPVGERAMLWFTCIDAIDQCIIVYLDKYNRIRKVEETVACFDRKLSYGTLLYGTLFINEKIKYFSCEDILYYKNKEIAEPLYRERMLLIKKIFDNELKQILYIDSFIVCGIPLMDTVFTDMINIINKLPYKIRAIRIQNINSKFEINILPYRETIKRECIFKVKANIDNDIYSLYCKDSKYKSYGNALIPSYKTSVMMNNIFRNIKENHNLDTLEESDSEDDFENIDPAKYVDLTKEIYMYCFFNKKFRKWVPKNIIEGADDLDKKLLSMKEIKNLEYN